MDAVKKFVVLRKKLPISWLEGNIWTDPCLFAILLGQGPMWPLPMIHSTSLYRSPDMGPHCIGTPWPQVLPCPPTGNIWWPSLETCSKLFTSGSPSLVLTSGGYWSTYGQHKLVVHILLDCFLVHYWLYVRDGNSAELLVVSGDLAFVQLRSQVWKYSANYGKFIWK